MAVQWSTTLRNAMLDTITTHLGSSWKIKIRTGAQPADVATASSGTVLVTYTPTESAAVNGVKIFVTGTPFSAIASAAGDAGHYELTTSGDIVIERGSVTVGGGGGDMIIDNVNINSGQTVQITGFSKTAPGA